MAEARFSRSVPELASTTYWTSFGVGEVLRVELPIKCQPPGMMLYAQTLDLGVIIGKLMCVLFESMVSSTMTIAVLCNIGGRRRGDGHLVGKR
jgi:hypothetical protein